jgi:hypothetical protein
MPGSVGTIPPKPDQVGKEVGTVAIVLAILMIAGIVGGMILAIKGFIWLFEKINKYVL